MSDQERRRQRSNRPSEALHMLLRATAERFQLDAMVLADEDGLVIQSTGDQTACDLVAAYAPLLQDQAIREDHLRDSLSSAVPAMSPCSVGHRPVGGVSASLHVCAVGVARNNLDLALVHATRSIERILTTLAVA